MGILGNVKLAQWDGVGEDGSPHPRGHGKGRSARTREGEKMGPRIAPQTREGEKMGPRMGPRIREDTGRGEDGSPHPRGHGKGRRWVPASARTREGEKMGPRIREDTGRGEGDSTLCIDTFGAGA